MNDVANHVLKAVKDLISDDVMKNPYNSLCESDAEPWPYGALLQEKIIQVIYFLSKVNTYRVIGNRNYFLYSAF